MKKSMDILIWALLLFLITPSGMALASWNAVPGDATYQWKVVGVYEDDEDNDVLLDYANLIVIPNNHLYKGGTGTAGV